MKKLFALMIIVAFAMALGAGCPMACKDGAKVTQALQSIVTDAQAIIVVLSATVPIPPAAQLVIAGAQTAINMANAAMAKACPTVDDINAVQNQMNQTMLEFKTSGLKVK